MSNWTRRTFLKSGLAASAGVITPIAPGQPAENSICADMERKSTDVPSDSRSADAGNRSTKIGDIMMNRKIVLSLVAALSCALCNVTATRTLNAEQLHASATVAGETPSGHASQEKTVALGESVYSQHCAICHGDRREGNPPNFPALLGVDKRLSPQQIVERIHNGRGRMPAFAQIQGKDLGALLTFLGVQADPEIVSMASDALYFTIPAATREELSPATRVDYDLKNWPRSNGDAGSTRYSRLAQVNVQNVHSLKMAWTYHSGDGHGYIECNPVIVNGVMYAPTVGHHIVAINAENGKEIWRFFAGADNPAIRGLLYWPGDGKSSARLFFTGDKHLYALDPKTGKLIRSFGEGGEVKSDGLVAPAIYKNVIVMPNLDVVDAFDVHDGRHLWRFHVLPGTPSTTRDFGGNCWGGMAMDERRGIAYITTGSPHPNFYGTGHPGRNRYSDSVIALDAVTGKVRWAFQDIRHDIWDLDIPAPPVLVTVNRAGQRVDAVAAVTKMGDTLLLDRTSGKPLFPFRLKRAPASTLPGEETWPYQPDPGLPESFSRQVFRKDDITNLTPEAHAFVSNQIKQAKYGWFQPFAENIPTVLYGILGGGEWMGGSFDPATGWLYVSANNLPWIITVIQQPDEEAEEAALPTVIRPGQQVFLQNCARCHGDHREGRGMAPPLRALNSRFNQDEVASIVQNGRNSMPPVSLSAEQLQQVLSFLFYQYPSSISNPKSGDLSYTFDGYNELLDDRNYPGTKPPWGTLNAINLNTGRIVWKVPLGEYPELKAAGIAKTGTVNFGGASVTAGGLVFCAGTQDHLIRAFNKKDGSELWSYKLPYGGYAPPAIYAAGGKEYIVIAATSGGKLGGKRGDTYVAFALPKQD